MTINIPDTNVHNVLPLINGGKRQLSVYGCSNFIFLSFYLSDLLNNQVEFPVSQVIFYSGELSNDQFFRSLA